MPPVVAEHTMTPAGPVGPVKHPRFLFWEVAPLTRRRIDLFKANRRGFFSLMVFIVIFVGTLFAEFIANDNPLYISMGGRSYFPVLDQYPLIGRFVNYTERDFGGTFQTKPNYREDYFAGLVAERGGRMVWAPIRFSHGTVDRQLPPGVAAPAPPMRGHLLGTDDSAHDVLARLIYGVRESISFALILTAISSILGVIAGALQGYYGGPIDLFFQRWIEIWRSLPYLFLIIILASIITPSLLSLIGILLIFDWMNLVPFVRAEFLRVRNFEYVKAAKALGVRDRVIIFRHALPNAMVASITFLPFIMSGTVASLTSLDFLGYGLPPGKYARLGELLNQGKNNTSAPWLTFSSFFTIALMLMLLVFIGEAVRDAFDPRKTVE
jgi:microcin C transport system permease protein